MIEKNGEILEQPRYSKEEIHDKFLQYSKTHDIRIRNELVDYYLKFAIRICRYISKKFGFDEAQLWNYGCEGLIAAIESFDPNRGVKFTVYANKYIYGFVISSMSKEFYANDRIYFDFIRHKKLVEKEFGVEYSGQTEMLERILDRMIADNIFSANKRNYYRKLLRSKVSIEQAREDGTEIGFSELPEDEIHSRIDIRAALEQANLSEIEKKVIYLHYGLEDGTWHTLKEIGQMLGVTPERVRQIELMAFRKLKRYVPMDEYSQGFDEGIYNLLKV